MIVARASVAAMAEMRVMTVKLQASPDMVGAKPSRKSGASDLRRMAAQAATSRRGRAFGVQIAGGSEMLEKIPAGVGHALRGVRAGFEKIVSEDPRLAAI